MSSNTGADGRRARIIIRYVAGGAVAALAAWAAFRRVDHEAVRDAMHAASLSWTVAALASTLATITLVTWRSGLLLDAGVLRHWRSLWSAVVIGQAVNIVFPLRLGEAARVASMAHRTGWPVGRVVLALVLERFCDVSAFCALLLWLVMQGALPARLTGALPSALAAVFLIAAVALSALALLPLLQRRLDRPGPQRSRAAEWLSRQATDVSGAWGSVMRGPRAAAVLLLTALVLIASVSTNYFVIRAFDLPVPPSAAFVLLVVLQVGTAVVSVPGNVGVFQYLTMAALATWDVSQSAALAAALVLHVVSLGPRVALGAIAALSVRLGRRR